MRRDTVKGILLCILVILVVSFLSAKYPSQARLISWISGWMLASIFYEKGWIVIKKKPGELTEQERKLILEIANQNGCDRDGDIISFFVKEDQNVVTIVNRTPHSHK